MFRTGWVALGLLRAGIVTGPAPGIVTAALNAAMLLALIRSEESRASLPNLARDGSDRTSL